MEARKNIFFAAALGLCALAAMASLGPAQAQQLQDLDAARRWCYASEAAGFSLDIPIRGCSTLILSGTLSNSNLAAAYYDRGFAYSAKGQSKRAIQDYDQAIKLDPSVADAYYNRGIAYSAKGQLDRAIQDFDQAIKLDPSDANFFYERSLVRAKKGDKKGADADLAAARRTGIPAQAQQPWRQPSISRDAVRVIASRKACDESVAFTPNAHRRYGEGFVVVKDVNGDGIKDYILDYGKCDRRYDSGYCGKEGCAMEVFASLPDGRFAKVLGTPVYRVRFTRVKGRPAMLLNLHQFYCETGLARQSRDRCIVTLFWDGSRFICQPARLPGDLPRCVATT